MRMYMHIWHAMFVIQTSAQVVFHWSLRIMAAACGSTAETWLCHIYQAVQAMFVHFVSMILVGWSLQNFAPGRKTWHCAWCYATTPIKELHYCRCCGFGPMCRPCWVSCCWEEDHGTSHHHRIITAHLAQTYITAELVVPARCASRVGFVVVGKKTRQLQPEDNNQVLGGEKEENNDLSPPRLRSTSSLVDEDSFIREAMEGCAFTTMMQNCFC